MKLFGGSKKSKHVEGAPAGGGPSRSRRSRRRSSGKRKALIVLGSVAGVLAAAALAVVIFYKLEVKPPIVTRPGLNDPSRVTDPTGTGLPGDTRPVTPGPSGATDAIGPSAAIPDGVYTVLVAARDVAGSNTDAIMVAKFDTRDYTLNVVSIPRDTLVNVSYRSKLVNAMYAYGGTDGLMEGITDLVGFRPDFYVVIKLRAIEKIIDDIGGVDYNVPQNMDYDDDAQDLHIHFKKGMTHMNGKQAVEYMRFRKGYADADIGRIKAQHEFLTTMVKQILANTGKVNITSIVDIFLNDVKTDLDVGECTWFAKELLKMDAGNVKFDTMPGNYNDYYKGRSYVTVTLDEWLAMINDMINPYNVPVTVENLNVLTRDAKGKMISTTGVFADSSFGSSSGNSKPSTTTPSSTKPSTTTPSTTKPTSTKPQETKPPATDPPGTKPSETTPAGTTPEPTGTTATEPPSTHPATQPPTDPATTTDPADPPETDPAPSSDPTDPAQTDPPETAPSETTAPPETDPPETTAPKTDPPETEAPETPAEPSGETENT